MCRMLVVGNDRSGFLEDKTRIFTNLLGLSVELEFADDLPSAVSYLACGLRVDVVMSESGEDSGQSTLADCIHVFSPDIKWIFLADQTDFCSPTLCTLENPVDIKGFFTAISQLSPETVSRVPSEYRNNRWYANQSVLTERILHVLNIIHTDYMEDLSLNYLAEQVYTSPCYFSTMFTRFLGISPMAYLNELRMNKAEALLRDSDINLQQICDMVGYRNLPYFCTCFKRKHQMTPTQFRRQCCAPIAS